MRKFRTILIILTVVAAVAAAFFLFIRIIGTEEKTVQEVESLNEAFISIFKEKTPAWNAFPAVKTWWEAKVAKEEGRLNLSADKLEEAITLISSAEKAEYEEILEFAGVKSRPVPAGKLRPPVNGSYTGIWADPFCSPYKCVGFDEATGSHSALVFDVYPWRSHAEIFDYNPGALHRYRYFSWDDMASFEDSIIIEPALARDIAGEESPLVLTPKQRAELLAEYGSVWTVSWITGVLGGEEMARAKSKGVLDKFPTTSEILAGEWDDYIRKTAREIKNIKAPILMELTHEFDSPTFSNNAWWSFGKNADESPLSICNPEKGETAVKLLIKDLAALWEKIQSGEIKTDCPELYNQYKDPEIPDGPERVRDIWIRVGDIFREEGVQNVTWFQHTGESYGTLMDRTMRPWNKLDYYWPGKDYIDFIGTSSYYKDTESRSAEAAGPSEPRTFHASSRLASEVLASKYWKEIPVLLLEFTNTSGETEEKSIERIFCDYLPGDFENIKGFTFHDWPPLFGSEREIAAWKKCVSENPYYIQYPVIN